MCTITLQYNPNNPQAQHQLEALLATGLFLQTDILMDDSQPNKPVSSDMIGNQQPMVTPRVMRFKRGNPWYASDA